MPHVCPTTCKLPVGPSFLQRSHLHIHEPHDFHMITYLESDIKEDRSGFLLE